MMGMMERTVAAAAVASTMMVGASAKAGEGSEGYNCDAAGVITRAALDVRSEGASEFDAVQVVLQGHDKGEGIPAKVSAYRAYKAVHWAFVVPEDTLDDLTHKELVEFYIRECRAHHSEAD